MGGGAEAGSTWGCPRPTRLLAPAAVGLALAAGLGIAAFEVDLAWLPIRMATARIAHRPRPRSRVGVVPALIAAAGGSVASAAQRLRGVVEVHGEATRRPAHSGSCGSGQPSVCSSLGLGARGRGRLRARLTTVSADITDLWAGTPPTAHSDHRRERLPRGGWQTDRLGSLLGPMGIRYIVVPERLAPSINNTPLVPAPAALTTALDSQLDLRQLDVDDALHVYENTSWTPVRASSPVTARSGRCWWIRPGCSRSKATSRVGAVTVAEAPNDRGSSRSAALPRTAGSTNSLELVHDLAGRVGVALVRHAWTRTAAIAGQGVLWVLTILLLMRWRTSTPWRAPWRRPAVTGPRRWQRRRTSRTCRPSSRPQELRAHDPPRPDPSRLRWLLVAGLVVDRTRPAPAEVTFGTATAPVQPIASPPSAETTTWFCPGMPAPPDGTTAGFVTMANPTDEDVTATLTVVPSEGSGSEAMDVTGCTHDDVGERRRGRRRCVGGRASRMTAAVRSSSRASPRARSATRALAPPRLRPRGTWRMASRLAMRRSRTWSSTPIPTTRSSTWTSPRTREGSRPSPCRASSFEGAATVVDVTEQVRRRTSVSGTITARSGRVVRRTPPDL